MDTEGSPPEVTEETDGVQLSPEASSEEPKRLETPQPTEDKPVPAESDPSAPVADDAVMPDREEAAPTTVAPAVPTDPAEPMQVQPAAPAAGESESSDAMQVDDQDAVEMIEPAARPQQNTPSTEGETEKPKNTPEPGVNPSAGVSPYGQSGSTAVRPIALLLDHLASEDIQTRAGAMGQCTLIAEALGPERTRNEFVPFLSNLIDDDEEVLYSMIEQLTKLVEYIGGDEYLYLLFPPFEQLCVVEEHSIRRSAASALADVIKILPEKDCETHALQLCRRLAASDWHTARMSAPLLCLATYHRVCPKSREQIREWLQALVKDTMPMVRRDLVKALGMLMNVFEERHTKGVIMDMFRQLAGDAQDSVRLLCVEGFSKFAEILGPAESQTAMQTMIRQACLDSSWRVRYIAAENFSVLCNMCGKEAAVGNMLDIFVGKLLKDAEPEVRAVASQQVAKVAEIIGPALVTSKLIPAIQPIIKDSVCHVRAALASVVVKLFGHVVKDDAVTIVLPSILEILQDTYPQVRLHVLRTLSEASAFVTPESIREAILPVVVDLAIAKDWRVRRTTIDLIPQLSTQLGTEFFNQKLLSIVVAWLEDEVASVRKSAAVRIASIASAFGDGWVIQTLLKRVQDALVTKNYLHRMSLIDSLTSVALISKTPECQMAIFKILEQKAKDKIPNVRFKICQSIGSMRAHDKIAIQDINSAVKLLQEMASEADPDVIYFANQALRRWDNSIVPQ